MDTEYFHSCLISWLTLMALLCLSKALNIFHWPLGSSSHADYSCLFATASSLWISSVQSLIYWGKIQQKLRQTAHFTSLL